MTELVVLHDLGAAGGAPWAEAFADWPGSVLAPDLPGHGQAPAPLGGHHEPGDAVYEILGHLRGRPPADRVVVVGVGRNGHAAQLLALGGRAVAVALVDGLGGPWLDVAGRNEQLRTVRRRILDTPAALQPHRAGTTDPRASLVAPYTDLDHARRVAAAVPVPMLAVETPSSSTPDAAEVLAPATDHQLVEVADATPTAAARAVLDWWSGRDARAR